jgi:hypothetical protein
VSSTPTYKYTEVEVMVTRVGKATSAVATLEPPIVFHEGVALADTMLKSGGLALRHDGDPDREDTGTKLAVGRSLINLGNKLIREASGTVKHHDDMKAQRAKQKVHKFAKETVEAINVAASKAAK